LLARQGNPVNNQVYDEFLTTIMAAVGAHEACMFHGSRLIGGVVRFAERRAWLRLSKEFAYDLAALRMREYRRQAWSDAQDTLAQPAVAT
jgi:hypothetical protein